MKDSIVKLYRMPQEAQKALVALKSKGYEAQEINDFTESYLYDVWKLDRETIKYYQWEVSIGGVLIGLHTDSRQVSNVRKIMRSVQSPVENSDIKPGILVT